MRKVNFNMILCESADENTSNINNIFDVITMDDEQRISFTVAVFINAIEWDVDRFKLYFFVQNLDKGLSTYLGSADFSNEKSQKKRSNGNYEFGSRKNMGQFTTNFLVEKLYIPEAGSYEIQLYMAEGEDAEDLDSKTLEESIAFAIDERLVATYDFEVEDTH